MINTMPKRQDYFAPSALKREQTLQLALRPLLPAEVRRENHNTKTRPGEPIINSGTKSISQLQSERVIPDSQMPFCQSTRKRLHERLFIFAGMADEHIEFGLRPYDFRRGPAPMAHPSATRVDRHLGSARLRIMRFLKILSLAFSEWNHVPCP